MQALDFPHVHQEKLRSHNMARQLQGEKKGRLATPFSGSGRIAPANLR
jgi:hypothetical protein